MVCARTSDPNKERSRRSRANYNTNKYYRPLKSKGREPIGIHNSECNEPLPNTGLAKLSRSLTEAETLSGRVNRACNEPLKRARYFKVFRPERNMLSVLENCYSKELNRKQYRANRYLYYVVVRHLAKNLWFGPDRERLQEVEHDLFNWLLSYQYSSGRKNGPNRVHLWSFRFPEVQFALHNSKSSKEPSLF